MPNAQSKRSSFELGIDAWTRAAYQIGPHVCIDFGESQVSELLDPAYAEKLQQARAAVAGADWE